MPGDRGLSLDEDMRGFFDGPVSVMLATADRLNTPDATRVAGLAPATGGRVRVLISTEARAAHVNVVAGAGVSVLVTNVTNYRSIQFKGTVIEGCSARTPGDLALMDRHIDAFRKAAPVIGISDAAATGIFPADVVALELEFDEVYNQTPGVGAGRKIG